MNWNWEKERCEEKKYQDNIWGIKIEKQNQRKKIYKNSLWVGKIKVSFLSKDLFFLCIRVEKVWVFFLNIFLRVGEGQHRKKLNWWLFVFCRYINKLI